MKYRRLYTALACIAFSNGAASWPNIGNIGKVPINEFPVQNVGEDKTRGKTDKRFRVVVTSIKDAHGNSVAGDLATPAIGALNKIIQESGAQNVGIDRSLRDKLDTEFQLLEAQGKSSYESPTAANLAINGQITAALITSKYQEKNYRVDPGTGHNEDQGPGCVYTATITGTLGTFEINPVKPLLPITLNGKSTHTSITRSSGVCRDISRDQSKNLYLEAVTHAFDSSEASIKTLMAAGGTVRQARLNPKKKKWYYRLSIPPQSGALPGIGVEFIEYTVFEGQQEAGKFAKGKIVCHDNKGSVAWAVLKTKDVDQKIKIGTTVQLKFNKNYFKSVTSIVKKIPLPLFGCNL